MRSMSSGCRAWRILRDARRADNKRPVVSARSRATGSLRRWAQFVCGNSRSQFIDRRTSVCHSRRLLAMAMTNAPLVNGAAGAGKARGKARASGSPRVRTGAWAARAAAGAVPRFRDTRYTKVCSTVDQGLLGTALECGRFKCQCHWPRVFLTVFGARCSPPRQGCGRLLAARYPRALRAN